MAETRADVAGTTKVAKPTASAALPSLFTLAIWTSAPVDHATRNCVPSKVTSGPNAGPAAMRKLGSATEVGNVGVMRAP